MHIPSNAGPIPGAQSTLDDLLPPFKGPRTTGDWSSIIGIVTAIIGNILISFALNTQRLAHVRLAREYGEAQEEEGEQDEEEAHRSRKSSSRPRSRHTNRQDYDSIQIKIAEERAVLNHKPGPSAGENNDETLHNNAIDETAALIPSLDRHSSHSSFASTAHEDEDEKSTQPRRKKNYLRSPYWWTGIILMTIGEAGNFLAYGFAPASIVSPLGVVALISNCLIAPIMLHERFRKRDLLGVVIAVGGAVTVVLSAEGSNPKLGPDEIWELITHWEFETYLGVTLGLMVVLTVLSNRYGDRTILIDLGLVGLFGGYTALSTKGVASLLSYRLWRVFTFPLTYLLVAVLVVTAVLQIKYVNRALQRFDSTQVIPVQFVMFTISVILGSAILYRDFEKATPRHIAQFVGGCALTFLGVWCITSGRTRNDDQRRDSHAHYLDEGEEDTIDLVDEEAREDEASEADDAQEEHEGYETQGRGESRTTHEAERPKPPLPPTITATTHDPSSSSSSSKIPQTPPASTAPRPNKPTKLLQPAPQTLTPPTNAQTRPQTQTQKRTSPSPSPQKPRRPNNTQHRAPSSTTSLPRPTSSMPTSSTSPSSYFTLPTHHNNNNNLLKPPAPPAPAPHPSTRRTLSSQMTQTLSLSLQPLTSPLSSGLSAVVADTLRRREYFPLFHNVGIVDNNGGVSPVVEVEEGQEDEGRQSTAAAAGRGLSYRRSEGASLRGGGASATRRGSGSLGARRGGSVEAKGSGKRSGATVTALATATATAAAAAAAAGDDDVVIEE